MCVALMGCDQEGGFKDNKRRGGTSSMQDGTVDLHMVLEWMGIGILA